MGHIHKRFSTEQVKELLGRYINKDIKREYVQQILQIGKTRLFALIKKLTLNPATFSIDYARKQHTRAIDPAIEKNILKELAIDKKLIENKNVPLNRYNYSYIQTRLHDNYHQSVSIPTIINRAKKHNLYLPKKVSPKVHDRLVLQTVS